MFKLAFITASILLAFGVIVFVAIQESPSQEEIAHHRGKLQDPLFKYYQIHKWGYATLPLAR